MNIKNNYFIKSLSYFTLLILPMLLLSSCQNNRSFDIVLRDQKISVKDEVIVKKLFEHLAKWGKGKKLVDDSCLFEVQTHGPDHTLCVVDGITIYQDGYLVENAEVNEWLMLLLDEQTKNNTLIKLFIEHDSVVIRADDVNISKELNVDQKSLLMNKLFQVQRAEENESIGYGFPAYPAYQILFDKEFVYLAPSYSGYISLFHKRKEYLIQMEKIKPFFESLELSVISEQSLAFLFGSQKAQFLQFQITDFRVDPLVRFLIQEGKVAPSAELGKLTGNIIFTKQGNEEVVLVYEHGFVYKNSTFCFPDFPEALQSAFTAD